MKAKLFCFLIPLVFLSCNHEQVENNGDGYLSGKISLNCDKSIIRADGNDTAVLSVTLTDNSGKLHDVTDDAEIYCLGNNVPIESPFIVSSDDIELTYYAVYGLTVSDDICIKAVENLTALPEDTDTESTAFSHRIMLLQHTGTECPNCPALMTTLKNLSGDEDYSSLYYHVASHSYNLSDPAYSPAAGLLSRTLEVQYYPWLTFNVSKETAYELQEIKNGIDALHKDTADVGICASSVESNGVIYVDVALKAGVSGEYKVALWLLEDSISGIQSGATSSWQNSHNNCLMEMAGETTTERIYGKTIGSLEKGESYSRIFALETHDNWKKENCKIMVITTKKDDSGNFTLANCTICPVDGVVEYSYINS